MVRTILLITLVAAMPVTAQELAGDEHAIEKVQLMVNALGGKKVWKEARTLFLVERARHPVYGDNILASLWIDLVEPGGHVEMTHQKLSLSYAWQGDQGWIDSEGVVKHLSPDEIEERRENWYRDMASLTHRLAAGDPAIRVRSSGSNGFKVFQSNGELIAEVSLMPDGHPYRWRPVGTGRDVTYLLGPSRRFGDVSFPDWITTDDGSWAFYLVQVQPSRKAFVYRDRFRKFDGGAINQQADCPDDHPHLGK